MSETPRLMPRSFAHLSDEAVVAMLARSDESALAELYDRFGRVAYGSRYASFATRGWRRTRCRKGFSPRGATPTVSFRNAAKRARGC